MKTRFRFLICFMAVLLTFFIGAKVVFMLYNSATAQIAPGDYPNVIFHGLSQDLTTVCYFSLLPFFLCMASVWVRIPLLPRILLAYSSVIALPLVLIVVGDVILYSYWHFKIDATIFNYLGDPQGIVASTPVWQLVGGLAAVAILCAALIFGLRATLRHNFARCTKRITATLAFVLAGGVMFLLIRGGIGRSTMNLGYVYYSSNQFLNHSAVNPVFSLLYSSFKQTDYNKLYQFFSEEEREANFRRLKFSTQSVDTEPLLSTRRPNIVFVLMEGLGAPFVEPLGGEKGVTPNLNRLIQEGISFSRCYANSFRTDRGTICALSGYPAFPDLSVMKLPDKSMSLPSIARSLALEGYHTTYLYGGDKNFTNANSYLISTGYAHVDGDEIFPASVRRTHSWGVTDNIVADTLYNQILRLHSTGKPFFITWQTLASHENWQVPYSRIPNNPKANAMAYLDDCIGTLTRRLRATPVWDNLLLIFIPDHGISYPDTLTESNIEKCHIPLIWAGGTVKSPRDITRICNQTDLAATLLGQLGISHHDFPFSRDVLSKTYTYPCAIHTFGGGVCFIDSTGVSIEDLGARKMLVDTPFPGNQRSRHAHTLLQTAIKDLSQR